MAKTRNKLDPHAAELSQWLSKPEEGGEGVTYKVAAQRLYDLGVMTASGLPCESAVAEWWLARQGEAREASILGLLTRNGQFKRRLKESFDRNAPPETSLLIGLVSNLILDLQLKGASDPEAMAMAERLTSRVLEWEKLVTKRQEVELTRATDEARLRQKDEEIALARTRLEQLICEKVLAQATRDLAAEIAGRNISRTEQIAAMRQALFADVDAVKLDLPQP